MRKKSEPKTAVGSFTPTVTTGSLQHATSTYIVPTLPYYPPPAYPGMGTPVFQHGWQIPNVCQPVQHVGHILGNPEVVAHCPFCGSGDIVAGGDQTISCSFCNRSFLVMEQPQYNSMPGQPGATTDATMPGGDVPDPTDPNAADPTQPDAAAPAHQPVNPQTDPDALSKAPPFKFGGSLKIAADDMVCETCGWPLMKDFGGYTHKSGFPGKPHRVKPVPATSSSSSSVGDDEGDDGLTDLGRKLRKQIEDGSIFRTASGHPVNEDDFVAHIAFQVARDCLVG